MSKGDEMQDIAVPVIYGDAEIRPLFRAQTGDSMPEIGEGRCSCRFVFV
jgi:hypothetical protein